MKIVLNKCYGGFKVTKHQAELLGYEWKQFPNAMRSAFASRLKIDDGYAEGANEDKDRVNPILIESVERGDPSSWASDLYVYEIPDGAHWVISNYDGVETLYWSLSEINEA
jgi:hypothetical protein